MLQKMFALLITLTLICCTLPALAEGTLRVGMECAYAPFNWQQIEESEFTAPIADGFGFADGYDVQIARRIAEALGMDLEIVKIDWNGLIPALGSAANPGIIDLIIAGMSPTEERRSSIDFTDYYYQSDLVIVVRADGPYANATSLADFSGAAIVAQQGTFHDQVVDQIPEVDHVMPMEDFPAMIVALTTNFVDGYISERPGAEAAITSTPGLTYVAFAEGSGFTASIDETAVSIGLVYDSPYKDAINNLLASISEDERQEIMREAVGRQGLAIE